MSQEIKQTKTNIYTRAQGKAKTRLVHVHKDEYRAFYKEEVEKLRSQKDERIQPQSDL
jgi:hypothetical protein